MRSYFFKTAQTATEVGLQMSFAYSAMVRSLENLPTLATPKKESGRYMATFLIPKLAGNFTRSGIFSDYPKRAEIFPRSFWLFKTARRFLRIPFSSRKGLRNISARFPAP
jgi:hypothetical protein